MKAYGIATKKSDTVFERTHTKFTGQSKASPFKTFSRKAPKRLFKGTEHNLGVLIPHG